MKDFEETKSFNIEDININKKEEESSVDTEDVVENIENDEMLDELDEIVMEEEIQGARVSEDELIEEVSESNFETVIEENDDTLNQKEESIEVMDTVTSLKDIVKNDFQEKTIIQMDVPTDNKIGIASDHRGYKLKQKLTNYLNKKGYTVVDYGTDSTVSTDYPEFGFKLGEAVANYEVSKGIAICGSGIGISIACNKIKGVRCAKVDNAKEIKYSRQDNDANVVAIAGNMPLFRAKDIIDAFLNTSFTGLERHQRRIDMLNNRG